MLAANDRAHSLPPSRAHKRADLDSSRAPNCALERKTRFELATPSLARRCSTTEPLPLARVWYTARPSDGKRRLVAAPEQPLAVGRRAAARPAPALHAADGFAAAQLPRP